MLAKDTKFKKRMSEPSIKDNGGGKRPTRDTDCDTDKPPFLTHSQDSSKNKYTVGDSKSCNGDTYYFCNCLIHDNSLK